MLFLSLLMFFPVGEALNSLKGDNIIISHRSLYVCMYLFLVLDSRTFTVAVPLLFFF